MHSAAWRPTLRSTGHASAERRPVAVRATAKAGFDWHAARTREGSEPGEPMLARPRPQGRQRTTSSTSAAPSPAVPMTSPSPEGGRTGSAQRSAFPGRRGRERVGRGFRKGEVLSALRSARRPNPARASVLDQSRRAPSRKKPKGASSGVPAETSERLQRTRRWSKALRLPARGVPAPERGNAPRSHGPDGGTARGHRPW